MIARRLLLVVVVSALAIGAGVGFRVWQKRAHAIALFVDNGVDGDVTVTLDGKTSATVPKYSFIALMTSKGKHTIVASRGGAPLEQVAFELLGEPGATDAYVYDVDGRNRYGVYVHDPAKPPLPVGVGARVFPIPPGVGRSFASRFHAPDEHRVFHIPLHNDRPCCKAFFAP